MTDYEEFETVGKIVLIPSERIRINKNRSLRLCDDRNMDELTRSLYEDGLILPIAVVPDDDSFTVISGERRLFACRKAGMTEIPCMILEADPDFSERASLIVNLLSKENNYFEESEAIRSYKVKNGFSTETTALRLGKSVKFIENRLNLSAIPKDVRDRMIQHGLSVSYANVILTVRDDEKKRELVSAVIENRLTLREAAKAAEELNLSAFRKNIVAIYRGTSIFENSISKAIETMLESGLKGGFQKNETDTEIEYHVVISKNG